MRRLSKSSRGPAAAPTGTSTLPARQRSPAAPNAELIWASPRELLNVYHADAVGCHIITATTDILKKLPLVGKDLTGYSLDTVKMFFDDARTSGFVL